MRMILLLQHVRDGVPLPSVQLPPPRKRGAAKNRWKVLKKCLPPSELNELRMQAPTTSRDAHSFYFNIPLDYVCPRH
jgi:hypothetical protein